MLKHFTKILVWLTFFLIFAGGMVKSTDSGLAVPDWPLSYGTWMPPMVGGVFYEHSHRMIASLVGLLMLILTIWIGMKEQRRWVRGLAIAGLGAVVLQGILGGLTVLFFLPTALSVFHGVLAQTFFLIAIFLAYTQSSERNIRRNQSQTPTPAILIKLGVAFIFLIYVQLILGAVMRHSGSGLAIPDFPTMGGTWLPLFDQSMLDHINDWRFMNNYDPVTLSQVLIHFSHRLVGVLLFVFIWFFNVAVIKRLAGSQNILLTLLTLDFLFFIQFLLGVLTVLTEKSPGITSVHVTLGAGVLGLAFFLLLRLVPLTWPAFRQNLKS